ncbi:MAG: hypothetical protein F6K19_34400 [Cyanothece sp. SIO1E1]|nr:hypothetical protein [Cyanothece sp. SIO1E1]
MISNDHHPLDKSSFAKANWVEVAAADLGDFQIVVPTANKVVSHPLASTHISIPKREYSREGWVIYHNQIISTLFALDVGEIVVEGCPFKPIKRLGPAVPIAFETRSRTPLPSQVIGTANFSCQVKNETLPYCSVFRQMLPRFVRLYPNQQLQREQILSKVEQMLTEESQFVAKYREQLKQVPFYREKFNLTGS